MILAFFAYVAGLSIWFRPLSGMRLLPVWILLAAAGVIGLLMLGEWRGPRTFFSYVRDWAPLALTLTAYREMDWFTPRQRDFHLEQAWVIWDRWLLHDAGLGRLIESAGVLIQGYLEFCYLLVYAIGPFTIAMVYVSKNRELVDRVLLVYLTGTLGAYALFPYFPSAPPWTVFPGADLPDVSSRFREFNLWLLRGYGIHSSVFPSAHVSSAFAAAWALILWVPGHKWVGRGMLVFAVSVAVATVYGRYHYAVDALAGLGVSVLAAVFCMIWRWLRPAQGCSNNYL